MLQGGGGAVEAGTGEGRGSMGEHRKGKEEREATGEKKKVKKRKEKKREKGRKGKKE